MATKRTPKTAAADEKPKKAVKAKAEVAPKAPAKKASTKAPKASEESPKKTTRKKVEEPALEAPVVAAEETPAPKAKGKKASAPVDAPDPLAFPFPEVLKAMRESRPVELIFKDAEANAPRTFEPRQLTFDALSQAWFVFGWDRRYNAERHHRLDLLAEVNDVEGVGRAAQGPYAEGTPGNQIGGWLGGEPIAVKALLHKQWVFAVKQAPPAFPQFTLKEQEDGKALATFTATDLRAIARWAMQFGDGITVQEPQRLVDRLRQVASAWAGKDLAKPAPAPAPAPRAEARPEREDRPRREDREDRPRREEREDRPRREEREERPRKDGKDGKIEVRIERL